MAVYYVTAVPKVLNDTYFNQDNTVHGPSDIVKFNWDTSSNQDAMHDPIYIATPEMRFEPT